MFGEEKSRRKKSYEDMCECQSCGEYFGSSEECPICGAMTTPIGKDIETFEPSRSEMEDDEFGIGVVADDEEFAYLAEMDGFNLDGEEFLADAV